MTYSYNPQAILRGSTLEYQQAYREYRAAVQKIRSNPWHNPRQLEQAADAFRNTLDELSQRHSAARDATNTKAEKRKIAPTPEATAKVQRALDRGFDFYSLVEQLVSEGDRVGLAALVAELPYLARDNKLPGDGRNINKMVDEAKGYIARREATLHDPQEAQVHRDADEVKYCYGNVGFNQKTLNSYLETEARTGYQGRASRDYLLHWQGHKDDTSLPKGLLELEAPVSV